MIERAALDQPPAIAGETPLPPAADLPEAHRRVLVVDDYVPSADALTEQLQDWGYNARVAYGGEQALTIAAELQPEIVVTDLVMPGVTGIELLERLKEHGLDFELLVLTGQGTIETAKQAIQKGAFDYLQKPVDPPHLRHLLELAVERLDSRRTMQRLRRVLQNQGWFDALIGESAPMLELYRLIDQVAPSSASVMITGESGTGKELVARTIHQRSLRASRPFIPVNCAAIPEPLLESELFGHEKGSFTGAIASRQGCFELAHGGTLFLDEIGEMPPALQAKLLRALEERAFRRVGGSQEIQVDVRVIAATNRDVDEARRSGYLREDLYYRLNVFHLDLPPLRARGDDKLRLAERFVVEFALREQKNVVGLDDETRLLVLRYHWPGNVRELRNAMERAVIVARGELIAPDNLPREVAKGAAGAEPIVLPGMTVDSMERQLIFMTLDKTGGNKTRAARLLGISLKTLHNKLRRYREEGFLPAPGAEEAPALRDPGETA